MLRLHLLVEGRTEFNFVNQVLRPHFEALGKSNLTVSMLTTKRDSKLGRKYSGGSSNYEKLSSEIKLFLNDSSSDFRLTTMLDLYKFPHGFSTFPEYKNSPYQRVERLEEALFEDFRDSRFIPYVQLHEYEALIFSDPQKFEEIYSNFKKGIEELVRIARSNEPEEINDGESTAPSKRIISNIPRYEFEKSSVGATVAQHIGINQIRKRCPHFSNWLSKLESA